ncbi:MULTISPECIES: sigma factor [Porphyromonas]|uniref:sigma factor n=1 Tax=Porphyromonas TaxID=836 RepID=UPI000374DA33|nr:MULTISPECIES: sigma factor [Porphyromonas]EOA11200.1 sigma-70 region 2 [Porphyromonas gingivalis JCVI SC001]ATS01545.1 hypothetical protein CS059_00080 [Porphyromonas gingivalis]ERJ67206.1 hypothetical protein HMPREF1553_01513 [Porphyromonas gingivalis F0568]MCE8187585.1 hypothetical protein [Porphyromonas gingivalis]PDP40512.1 hypothetical protein CLI84_09785 [Porphyromonas gingivalis]
MNEKIITRKSQPILDSLTPLLTLEEQLELVKRAQEGDEEALKQYCKSNDRFVFSVAKQYQGKGLSLKELMDAGREGLEFACKRFDPNRGIKLISYAIWFIKESIIQTIEQNQKMIAKFNGSLCREARIYQELAMQPEWWKQLLSIKGVYVEIRKDNIVEVYYEGGCMAKLEYKKSKKGLIATCHPKYLGKPVPENTEPKYEECLHVLKENPHFIIKNIEKYSSRKNGDSGEGVSEQKIQGDMVCSCESRCLDSEFAHRYKEGESLTLRIDLVTIEDNQLKFIELKTITDKRLLNKNDDAPEILEQMGKYTQFIKVNKDKLLEYYKELYAIKKNMGLPVPPCDIARLSVCETPHLIIRDTYTKYTDKRIKRKARIEAILERVPFTYEIERGWTLSYIAEQLR